MGWENRLEAQHPDGTVSLEQEAVSRRAQLVKNQKEGTGPRTSRKSKTENDTKREAEVTRLKEKGRSLQDAFRYWQESYFPAAKRSKKEATWTKEPSIFVMDRALLGALPMRSIGLKQWDELVKTLSSANLSPRSKEYITGTLRRILKHAYDRRMGTMPRRLGRGSAFRVPGTTAASRYRLRGKSAIMEYLSIVDQQAWRLTRFAFLMVAEY